MVTPMDMGYITVAERHAKFVEEHPNGAIMTDLAYAHDGLVIVKAAVWKDRTTMDAGLRPDGTGLASMPIPGPTNFTKNSEAENAETSAVGRALAMIGYHPKNTMASEDEIAMKAESAPTRRRSPVEAEEETLADVLRRERAVIRNWGAKVYGSKEATLAMLAEEGYPNGTKDIKTSDDVSKVKTIIALKAAELAKSPVPEGVTFD